MKPGKFSLAILAVLSVLVSCDKDDDDMEEGLNLSLTGLEDLGPDFRYEGWVIVNGTPVSTGKFTVNASGDLSQSNFNVSESDLQDASVFVLTIEPHPDTDPGPTETKILAGDFSGNTASLSLNHMAALGNSFSGAIGKYLLATPTTAAMTDEKSGVWFIDNSSGSPMPGLNIPALPAGWRYEGWTVLNGTPLTTGHFLTPNAADLAEPYSGPVEGPPFPGEDYVMNAPAGFSFPTDLSGGMIVLTIEPNPDNSAAPFFLKPLVGNVPANAEAMVSYSMTNNISTFPTGTASRQL